MNSMDRRKQLYSLLGDLPPRNRPVNARRLSVDEHPDGFLLERLLLNLNGLEPVPAYFIKPGRRCGKVPAVLYNHWHGGEYQLGKDELLRPKPAQGLPSWAAALSKQGYSALCIDHWCFGGRAARTESETFKEMLWKGRVLWGMMVYDSLKALDYLASRPDVNRARIATLGMSMGSTMAWWAAALDRRIKVTVDICCLTDFAALIESGGLAGHGVYYYVPSLLKRFTTSRINALIAPRPHLSLAGNLDPLTPPRGLDRIDRQLRAVYRQAGKPENWRLFRQDVAHVETPEMRAQALAWLARYL